MHLDDPAHPQVGHLHPDAPAAEIGQRTRGEGVRQRRPRDCEDEVTKNVFDALDDLEPMLAEVQGHLAVLKSSVRAEPHADIEALRAEKRLKADRREPDNHPHGDEDTGRHLFRVAPHILRQVEGDE